MSGYAACRFGQTGPAYDFIAPFPVTPGDRVWVETRHGKSKATVVFLKEDSDRATAKILEKIVETPDE